MTVVALTWSNTILMVCAMSTIAACARNEPQAPASPSAARLVGTVWQWQAFEDSADGAESNDVIIPDPTKYTLTLEASNAAIQADCNRVSWSYTLDGSSLTFDTKGPSTMAYCGAESLDQRYLQLLGNTASYVLVEGSLYLNLGADAGNMLFVSPSRSRASTKVLASADNSRSRTCSTVGFSAKLWPWPRVM